MASIDPRSHCLPLVSSAIGFTRRPSRDATTMAERKMRETVSATREYSKAVAVAPGDGEDAPQRAAAPRNLVRPRLTIATTPLPSWRMTEKTTRTKRKRSKKGSSSRKKYHYQSSSESEDDEEERKHKDKKKRNKKGRSSRMRHCNHSSSELENDEEDRKHKGKSSSKDGSSSDGTSSGSDSDSSHSFGTSRKKAQAATLMSPFATQL